MDSGELIELFYNRAYEKFVNKQILDDKNYIVPRQQLTNYVHELVNIPFIDFIDYIKENGIERIIEVSDVTQFTSFSVCEIEMCNALIWANNPGCQYVDIGRYFPNNIITRSDSAYRRYGENHIKASTQLGLTFEYYDYWYLSCLGYIYPDLAENDRTQLIARTITRNRLYQQLLIDILDHDVNPEVYINMLPDYILRRSLRCVCAYLDICLVVCKEENIKTHNLIKSYETLKIPVAVQLPPGTNKNLRTYFDKFDYRSLSRETTADLIKRFKNGDHKAYDILVKGYMRLVVNIAKSYNHKGVELEDLIQEGVLGLISAFEHFNVNTNVGFSKYASWWIMQTITQALTKIPLIVQVPLNVITLHRRIWRFINKFEQESGYPPSINDIKDDDSYDLEWFNMICQIPEDLNDLTIFVEDFDSFENTCNHIDSFENEEYTIYNANKLLSRLKGKEELIVRSFYGIGTKTETLDAIGDYYGLSRERTRQIVVKAIKNMRDILGDKDNREKNEENALRFSKSSEDVNVQRVIKPFGEATIGDYVEIPTNQFGKVIDIQKSKVIGKTYVVKSEKGVIYKYNKYGEFIPSGTIREKRMTPEREAFLRELHPKQNSIGTSHGSSNKTTDLHNHPSKEPRYQPSKRKILNSNTNVVYRDEKKAMIGDRIIYDSIRYTVIEKRSAYGYSRIIVRNDDGIVKSLPDDTNRYKVM